MKTIMLFVGTQELLTLVIIFAICLGIFLVIRTLVLWYWKIDTIVLNQEKQINALKAILQRLTPNDQMSVEDKSKLFDAIESAKQREHSKI